MVSVTVLYCGCSLYRCCINSSVPQCFTAQFSEVRTINKSNQGGGKLCRRYSFLSKFYATYLYVIKNNYALVKIFSTFPSVQCGFLSHRGLKRRRGDLRLSSTLVVFLVKELAYYSIELHMPLDVWRIYSKGKHCSRKRLEQRSCLKLLSCTLSNVRWGVKHFYYT